MKELSHELIKLGMLHRFAGQNPLLDEYFKWVENILHLSYELKCISLVFFNSLYHSIIKQVLNSLGVRSDIDGQPSHRVVFLMDLVNQPAYLRFFDLHPFVV